MTRIAICYSGRPRNVIECYENHQKYFGLGKENVDVFAHIWYDNSLSGQNFRGDSNQGTWPDESIKNWILKNWNPKKIIFDSPKSFNHMFSGQWENNQGWHNAAHKDNQISMLYSIDKAISLKQEYENKNNFKYDYVLRMRTDLVALKSFGQYEDYNKEYLHVWNCIPGEDWCHVQAQDYAFIDVPVLGSSEVMDKFSLTYSNLQKLLDLGCATFTPDILMGYNATKICNLQLERHNWKFKIFMYPYFYGSDGRSHYSCGVGISGEE